VAPRPLFTCLALTIPLLFSSACAGTRAPAARAPELVAPAELADLDDYTAARNAYALLDLGDPARDALRVRLRGFLIGYLDHALADQRTTAAVDALEHIAGLWTPSELRTASPDPAIAEAAMRVYARVARSGNERRALLALGVAQVFGYPSMRSEAEAGIAAVREWIDRTSEFADDPRMVTDLDRVLEDVTSVLPSPYLVAQLEAVYLARYRAAQAQGLSSSRDPRIEFTPYLLARLFLRADDLDGAVAAIDRFESDTATGALRHLIAAAGETGEDRTPADLDQLIREFVPEADSRLPDEIRRQSWGIVDNLARRALKQFPGHPPAELARGRFLRSQHLHEAAIIHYERAFVGKTRASDREDLFVAWGELAELYQDSLAAQAQIDPSKVHARLERVEDFHARAAAVWQHRPIQPGLDVAWLTVAATEFDAGHVAAAEALLERAIAIEPHPAALSLLGLIALRRGEFEQARKRLRGIESLVFADQVARYEWQIDARIRLGEVERLAGNEQAAASYLKEALEQVNTLLGYPTLGDALRVEFLVRRAQVFFSLGEIDLAMADFRAAQVLAPAKTSVYTAALTFTVVHGHYEQAVEIVAKALAEAEIDDELRVYFGLWVVDLADRLGREPPKDAVTYLDRYAKANSNDAWLRKLARFGLGQLGEGELTKAADDPRQRSEAFFYEGLRRWRSGSKAAGLELMHKVLEQQMLGDFEYEMAQNYLRWNELPKSARAGVQP
jgi:tetratricopeptide (TPR) repeat protein